MTKGTTLLSAGIEMAAQEHFEGFLRKYEPGFAAEAKKSLAKLGKLIPSAIEMV